METSVYQEVLGLPYNHAGFMFIKMQMIFRQRKRPKSDRLLDFVTTGTLLDKSWRNKPVSQGRSQLRDL